MSLVYLFNKPFRVLSQFTDNEQRDTLANFIDINNIYPAGRLDYDSEGLLLLTNDGKLQARIAEPKFKLEKSYWVQLEGDINDEALDRLQQGVQLKDGKTKPAKAKRINPPDVWPRNPPIRERKNQQTSWIELSITEGRNRQVRRMTAEVGFPTLRLIRFRIGQWNLDSLKPGEYRKETIHLPASTATKRKKHFSKKAHNDLDPSRNRRHHR